jgi:hypothetical protein
MRLQIAEFRLQIKGSLWLSNLKSEICNLQSVGMRLATAVACQALIS